MSEVNENVLQSSILVVDDNEANIQLLEMMLDYAGYTNVISTTDPREVEGLYKDNEFDIVLLDINMPHLDGFQVMEILKEGHDEDDYLPVLILTAQKDRETHISALEAGARDFVTKPFDSTEVLNRIANMLEVRHLYNERRRQNEILEEKVRERTIELSQRAEELTKTRLEIIQRLGRAAEFRDNETGMHIIRVSQSCRLLALAAGLDERTADRIMNASPMHDVGKIGIPDHILLKPGRLDKDEFEIMKTHAEIGGEILSGGDTRLMKLARVIAVTHHEKWDGSGYPKGLEGEDIPVAGRIAAVCDVFDALTSSRPYKKAWAIEDAVKLINEQSGAHFDPNLVNHFNKILQIGRAHV